MDRTQRSILIALVVVLGIALLAVIASLLVPYRVNFAAPVSGITGTTQITGDQRGAGLTESGGKTVIALSPGQTLTLDHGASATLTFDLNGGRALLTGPAELVLVDSYRRATSLGHLLESGPFSRHYTLTIEQRSGTARYFFDDTDPAWDAVDITIRLPQGNFTPDSPCWFVEIQADGVATTSPLACQ